MPRTKNLDVGKGKLVTFDDQPSAELEPYVRRHHLEKLTDLVEFGLVASRESLNSLVDAAKVVTRESMESVRHTRDVPLVRGTMRADLGRFRPFAFRTAAVAPAERDSFWRVVREFPPELVAEIKPTTLIEPALRFNPGWLDIIAVWAQDVTIESGATLQFTGSAKTFICHDLLIRKTGRIVVKGSGLTVKANSIKGEQ